jgi:effector-binding domain-containing protein
MSYDIEVIDLPEQPAAVVTGRVEHLGIADFVGPAFREVMQVVQHQGLQPAGPPFGRYRPTEDGGWDITAGFPVSDPPNSNGRVVGMTLPGGAVARTLHVGSYATVGAAYEAVDSWLGAHGYAPAGEPWESYLDGPDVATPRTEVCYPCRRAPEVPDHAPGRTGDQAPG